MAKSINGPLLLLAISVFLAPIIGGQVYVEAMPLAGDSRSFVSAALGGFELPTVSHTLLVLLAASSFAWSMLSHRANQMINWRLGLSLALFALVLCASIGVSKFQFVSLRIWFEWLGYLVGLAATVACAGRRTGVVILLSALVAGCAVAALQGVSEYSATRAADPTHRIFANWNNPNALGGVLLLGLFPATSLLFSKQRISKIAAAASFLAIFVALILTQSKGALWIAMPVGVITMSVMLVGRLGIFRAAAFLVIIPIFGALLYVGIQSASTSPGSVPRESRLVDASATSTQSEGVRKLLWQSAIDIGLKQPLGVGIGAFRYMSAKPGYTNQTHFAHNSLLQIFAEGGWAALFAALAAFGFWASDFFRGGRSVDAQTAYLRAGILGAIVAVGTHSMIDSDLHFFGIGFLFFVLMGIGLQASADGSNPELMPFGARAFAAGFALLVALVLAYFGVVEYQKARFLYALQTRDPIAIDARQSLMRLAPRDGEVSYLASFTATSPSQRIQMLKDAVKEMPSTKLLRTLARVLLENNQDTSAIQSLLQALNDDPNNLPVRLMLARAYAKQERFEDLEAEVGAMINIERTPYFQVRALPEVIPTETYEARILLQKQARELQMPAREQIELLKGAVDGFEQYLNITYPRVKLFASQTEPLPFGGETLEDANRKLDLAAGAARQLAEIYSSVGEEDRADLSRRLATKFESR